MPVLEDFKCPLKKIASVEDWMKRGDQDGNCPPCLITPLASHYLGTLGEAGEKEKVQALEKAYNSGDALTIARALDKIKKEVGGSLKKNLESYDCYAQVFKEDA